MSWWDSFRKGLRDELSNTDRRVAGEIEGFIEDASASGATTDEDRIAAWNKWFEGLTPEQQKAAVEELQDQRAQLEAMLTSSGYKGDLDAMSVLELARLAAARGLWGVSGDGTLPTGSALDAAAAASGAGGSWSMNPETGGITIFSDDAGKDFHEYIPGGQEGRPAAIVESEIWGGSEPGGARPTADQIREAATIQEANPGSGVGFGDDGSVEVTRSDGTVITVRNNPLQQGLEDLEASAGDLRGIGDALDGAATRTVENLADGISSAFDRAKPSFGGGAVAGMGGTGSATVPGMTTGGGTPDKTPSSTSTSSGSRPGSTSGGNTSDPSMDVDEFDTFTRPSKPSSSGSTSTGTPAQPASTEPNEIVERSGEKPSESSDDDDGYRPSTIPPPTDATHNDDEDDGAAEQPQPDSDGDGIPDDQDEDTVLGYTPAPDGENRRDWDEDDWERARAAADARGGWSDRPPVKAPEYDPEFAARMRDRKFDMIGNPGDEDQDMGTPDGALPGSGIPVVPDADDDTPGHNTDGVDTGAEDRLLNPPTPSTLDSSILDDDAAPVLPLQEMAIAEIDPALSAPLATSVEAEVNIEGTPAIPGYHYAIGDPVPSTPEPEPEDELAIAARTDTRLGGQLSIPTGLRLPTKDADPDDEPPEG